ncbi:glutamine--fructose-6-phosphate transaminase (isomerizing) [Haloglomus litoreum]|uniref:glutamine--fructose-6-phosphate transaminase (isomerizing) n=1 Tax=Haloglomus litoreum TaxID=3034026 RepID=UPI0023E78182|nr:glutamine--fructose-6-phosphate transaminase (isomerizing) [Haloglomus sp. DT116]
MCGIIGLVGHDDAVPAVLDGLGNLEYRGYDSAGVAMRNGHGLEVAKRAGEISDLAADLTDALPEGELCIGHTRWSTHGAPTDANAHPHTDCTGKIAVVHNGIVENHAELRRGLETRGHEFDSDTDTEVIPHLVEEHLEETGDVGAAFRRTLAELEGSYAIAMVVADGSSIHVARQGSPLVIGLGDGRSFVASDVPAFLEHTDRVIYLEDGDVAEISAGGYRIATADGEPADRPVRTVDWAPEDARKEGYDHYMLKEINEQPDAIRRTLHGRLSTDPVEVDLDLDDRLDGVERVHLVACGTSYHASLYGAHLLSRYGTDAGAWLASEYPGRMPTIEEGTLVVGVTQSGETADTLSALRHAADSGARTMAVTNVLGSTAARECDEALFIRAGPEIGVAASKTFSSQVVTLTLLAGHFAARTGGIGPELAELLTALPALPGQVETVLAGTPAEGIARRYHDQRAHFFIGRGTAHPVALEGALKFKEISYEHAEGFPAGELKHGPLALVTEETPVVAIFTGRDDEKTLGNVREVRARGAPVIAVASERTSVGAEADEILSVPETHPDLQGLLANVQLQLLAYHVSDLLDRAIDKPRHLAKSVTVE